MMVSSQKLDVLRNLLLAVLCLLLLSAPAALAQMKGYELEEIEVEDVEDLRDWLEDPIDFVDIVLQAGEYRLIDSEIDEDAEAVEGAVPVLRLSGERLNISAAEDALVTLIVDARHALVFENCRDCSIRNVVIRVIPGASESDSTNLISVFNSSVSILETELQLADRPKSADESQADTASEDQNPASQNPDQAGTNAANEKSVLVREDGPPGDDAANGVPELGGEMPPPDSPKTHVNSESVVNAIHVGNGSRVTINGNVLRAFNGDGIVVSAAARAKIRDNVIIGSRLDSGAARGQGTGMLIRDEATAQIKNNLIKHCYKGIGIRDDADAIVKDNVLEFMTTWGIALWQSGPKAPVGMIQHNIVYHTGACGALISLTNFEDGLGLFNENLLVKTGQDERLDAAELFCYQTALAVHAAPEEFEFRGNTLFANRVGDATLPDQDSDGLEFEASLMEFCEFFQRKKLFAEGSIFLNTLCGHEAGMFNRGE